MPHTVHAEAAPVCWRTLSTQLQAFYGDTVSLNQHSLRIHQTGAEVTLTDAAATALSEALADGDNPSLRALQAARRSPFDTNALLVPDVDRAGWLRHIDLRHLDDGIRECASNWANDEYNGSTLWAANDLRIHLSEHCADPGTHYGPYVMVFDDGEARGEIDCVRTLEDACAKLQAWQGNPPRPIEIQGEVDTLCWVDLADGYRAEVMGYTQIDVDIWTTVYNIQLIDPQGVGVGSFSTAHCLSELVPLRDDPAALQQALTDHAHRSPKKPVTGLYRAAWTVDSLAAAVHHYLPQQGKLCLISQNGELAVTLAHTPETRRAPYDVKVQYSQGHQAEVAHGVDFNLPQLHALLAQADVDEATKDQLRETRLYAEEVAGGCDNRLRLAALAVACPVPEPEEP